MSLADIPRGAPARDYEDAAALFSALAARDTPVISAAGHSRFFGHGRRTRNAFVFVHGFTNCPEQWVPFATSLHAEGHSVVIPRLPGHGHADRNTHALARVTAKTLLATVGDAVDIACGAGERVVVAGLSIGGTMAPWIALHRGDVAHAVAIVPFFAVSRYNMAATRVLARVLAIAPNAFVPWDPFGDGSQIPVYGYPRFSTRMLGECLDIGDDVAAMALVRRVAESGFVARTTFVLNAKEPACNNDVSVEVRRRLERSRPGTTRLAVWGDLPANHDIIDPTNPKQRTEIVYPRLRTILLSEL